MCANIVEFLKSEKVDTVDSEQNDSFDGMREEKIYLYWMLFIAC